MREIERKPSTVESPIKVYLDRVQQPNRDAIAQLENAKDKLKKPQDYIKKAGEMVKGQTMETKAREIATTVHLLRMRSQLKRGYQKRITKIEGDEDLPRELAHITSVINSLQEARKKPEVHNFYTEVISNASRLGDEKLTAALEKQRARPVEDVYLSTVEEPFAPYPTRLPKDDPIFTREDPPLAKIVAHTALTLMGKGPHESLLLTGSDQPIPNARKLIDYRHIGRQPIPKEVRDQLQVPKSDLRVVRDVYTLLGLGDKAPELSEEQIRNALTVFGGEEQRRHVLSPFNLNATFIFAGDRGDGSSYVPPHVSLEVSKFSPTTEVPLSPDLDKFRDVKLYIPGSE